MVDKNMIKAAELYFGKDNVTVFDDTKINELVAQLKKELAKFPEEKIRLGCTAAVIRDLMVSSENEAMLLFSLRWALSNPEIFDEARKVVPDLAKRLKEEEK